MIDTGCQVTILATSVFEKMCAADPQVRSRICPCARRLVSADSSPLTVIGELELDVVFPGLKCIMCCIVVDNDCGYLGVGRPGSVPFVSHRPGAYGRLLLAVYVRWKTGLLVSSDWFRPVTRGAWRPILPVRVRDPDPVRGPVGTS